MEDKKFKLNPKIKEVLEWSYCILIALVLALLVRYYLGTPTIVQQPSMYPTLKSGQRLILNRWARTVKAEYKRGDIVTFEAPSSEASTYNANLDTPLARYESQPKTIFSKFVYYVLEMNKTSYIKRVIALPGEHVKIEDNKVYINGKLLDEPYLQSGVITDKTGPYVDLIVPENSLFVMGDNRGQSTDSRRFGCIPYDKIESKVAIRFWPLNLFGKV